MHTFPQIQTCSSLKPSFVADNFEYGQSLCLLLKCNMRIKLVIIKTFGIKSSFGERSKIFAIWICLKTRNYFLTWTSLLHLATHSHPLFYLLCTSQMVWYKNLLYFLNLNLELFYEYLDYSESSYVTLNKNIKILKEKNSDSMLREIWCGIYLKCTHV